jgi:hypothetical protein
VFGQIVRQILTLSMYLKHEKMSVSPEHAKLCNVYDVK